MGQQLALRSSLNLLDISTLFPLILNKGAGSRDVKNFFRNDDFSVYLRVDITEIFRYLSQNIGVILKMGSWIF